ncbi:MAG: LPS export ABC transporter periplasmic protein LptC [Bacteriovoracaceae bacterium]|nr:LPS export ABC transporter periplasmic protein LptC [Bacteriovoracaceae bacterium]
MKIRDIKSIIIISTYLLVNGLILTASYSQKSETSSNAGKASQLAPEYTVIEKLDYFHLKEGLPQMSLAALSMRSQGQEIADFEEPRGVYNYQKKNKTIRYSADSALYQKKKETLSLDGKVEFSSEEATYFADKVKYFFKKDLVLGSGNVKFEGDDLKTKDHLVILAEKMRAKPEAQITTFKGQVRGTLERKKKYEGRMTFSSHEMELQGAKSLANLRGDVVMNRHAYLITAGKADMYLENYNKSLKYFVLNDDVKVTERMQTPEGVQERKAFAGRLEGFGREQKMILSGAPRVEMGEDVIKGYRITIRENVDLIEVDDAMSDVQVKRKKLKE